MQVVVPHICQIHKKQANMLCTRNQCFQNSSILICPDCSSKHFQHRKHTIEMSLLNQKVHELMKKRVEFQEMYDKSCEGLINQLKKFKMFKEQLFTSLNIRERILNDLCKKIKKKVPYQKDKQLFKNHFGYIYLTMKGLNPNLDIYSKFKSQITQTMASCRNLLRKFQLNCGHTQIPSLLKKQYQISSIIKKSQQQTQHQLKYFTPIFNKFKKQTIKFKIPSNSSTNTNSNAISNSTTTGINKTIRINSNEFLAIHDNHLSWYNISNFLFPKTIPMGRRLSNIALIDKNAFITTEQAGILIYDILNEKILKQFTSSNHKNASITGLLAVNPTTVLNFITCPNQIVSLKFTQQTGCLKVHKGIETDSKHLANTLLHDNFVALYDSKTANLFNIQTLDKQRQYQFDNLMKCVTKLNQKVFAVGGECEIISIVDTRSAGCMMKIRNNGEICTNLVKIYPYGVLTTCGKIVKIYDIRKIQNQIFSTRNDDNVRNIQVLSSDNFVTIGNNNLTWWQSVQE